MIYRSRECLCSRCLALSRLQKSSLPFTTLSKIFCYHRCICTIICTYYINVLNLDELKKFKIPSRGLFNETTWFTVSTHHSTHLYRPTCLPLKKENKKTPTVIVVDVSLKKIIHCEKNYFLAATSFFGFFFNLFFLSLNSPFAMS